MRDQHDEVEIHIDGPLDPTATLSPLVHGRWDPSARLDPHTFLRAWRTAEGVATLRLSWDTLDPRAGGTVRARAWGPGASIALASAGDLLGLGDEVDAISTDHRAVKQWITRRPGLRMCRAAPVLDTLVAAILGQRVQSVRARRSWARLVRTHGQAAPGPEGRPDQDGWQLHVPPSARTLASLPPEAFHPLDVERQRSDTIRRAAASAHRLEEIRSMSRLEADERLQAIPGIGRWTSATTRQSTNGDPDAVVVGDANLPNIVAFGLAGEPRAGDERMLELLEPFKGQRARVQRLAKLEGPTPPRYGPKLALGQSLRATALGVTFILGS